MADPNKPRGRPPKTGNKGLFTKDIRLLMYGFGDEPNPAPDSINVMEELVVDYITEMCHKATDIAKERKVNVEDFKFILRNDPKKLARVEELLHMEQEIKRARQNFDVKEIDEQAARRLEAHENQ
ncbi:10677_t:CDS:2 [Acaulospora morrowiae]|uniref:Transcription initiation factor TFIID subunit 13 n=1 Tax=Acaulospora morrowiae TaxID=94023 RepID=A0A9N9F7K7_9GLOM|nr:10677_t:CDS:2 [Acaulospora morrowiae]